MKIIHTADWHLGKSIEGRSRIEEQEAFLLEFAQIVEEEQADLILIAGDIYDSFNPSARAEGLCYSTLKKLSKNGERLVLVIAGNHDNPDRLMAASSLAMEHGIIMVGTPKTVIPVGCYGKNRVLDSGEGYVEVELGSEKAVILTVPFPSEKRLNEVLYDAMDYEETKLESYEERLRGLFDSLEEHYREDTVNLVLSHLFVMGGREEGSERSIELGGSYLVSGTIFPKTAQYIALGHIHKPQVVPGCHKARYAGSPLHYHKGEGIYEKQVLAIEVKAGEACEVKSIPIKQEKPIEVWKCRTISDAIETCERRSGEVSWVYLEIETDRVILENEIKEMKRLKADILEIRPIIVRMEEDQTKLSFHERPFQEVFQEFYLYERGVEATKETMDMLRTLLEEDPL